MSVIQVQNVCKDFKIPKKVDNPSFWQKVGSIFYRKWETVSVLKDVSFKINEGEFVGYVGPNGAGKSTTIKLLTGVLTPTSGNLDVLGFSPTKQRYKYTYNIGVVFGHRTLLEFDIPVIESLKLYKDIYELTNEEFKERLEMFSKMLKIDELLHIPVRKLSLGQRMRCEIAASLLHKPKVLFLDEPTIGLDAIAKDEIRDFLTRINKKEKTTIILTTHDMDDIEALCKRIIIIDQGKLIYDGDLQKINQRFIKYKNVEAEIQKVTTKKAFNALLKKVEVVTKTQRLLKFRVALNKFHVPDIIDELMDSTNVVDLIVHEPRLENVIKEIYQEGV